ncbi:Glycoside hydrolase [Trema orientale]|uniref:endo-polygalacturonase n=1 Tax=Trema orientale TaxID=63057 RepID=A0A2P5EU07_TREOI|nr:Glycoside hydrolase [Trema orientale]
MGVFRIVLILGLVSATISCSNAHKNPKSFNVLDYGAVSDGITDDSEAFLEAWNEACSSTGSENPTLVIPNQNFLLKPVVFSGPCQANNISLQILGSILAPASPKAWEGLNPGQWLAFQAITGLNIAGPGQIDGQGSGWWDQSCRDHPTLAVKFLSCKNCSLSNIHFINSSQAHVSIRNCDGININNLTIEAPGNSPNTDGIHIHASQNLIINNIDIGTGDDCISIGDHTSNIQISQIRCGPGHGISIGSLGKGGSFVQVESIYVSRVYLNGTSNGARIKTWQVGKGYVRGVIFEQFYLDSVKNPIIIDQNYCNIRGACKEQHTGVKISNVAFSDFKGTSSSDVAINLNCSRAVACTGILLTTIQLKSAKLEHNVTSSCTNAHGYSLGVVEPGSCLQN